MGNLENCLSRNQIPQQSTNRPSTFKIQFAPSALRHKFLEPVDVDEVCNYAQKMGIKNYNPYSKANTSQIIQLHKKTHLEYSLCRFLLLLGEDQMQQIVNQSDHSVRIVEDLLIRKSIQIVGLDFKNGLTLQIQLDQMQLVQQYFLYFMEYLLYEIATSNRLSNHIQIIYDLQFGAVNPIFLNFLANLNLKLFVMKIHKIILVNINIEKISSEVIALFQTPYFQHTLLSPVCSEIYQMQFECPSKLQRSSNKIIYKMIDIVFEDIKLETIPTNFENLTMYIEKVLYHKLPSMYNIILRDEQDVITLTNEEEFQAALQMCQTKKQKCLLEVINVDIDASIYLLKKQISTEQSMIFQQSQMEIKQKLAELQSNRISTQSNYSFFEESVYSKKDSDLQIPEIMSYYSNALVKFIDNYSAQNAEYRQQNETVYRNTFEKLLNRMTEKLQNQFEITTKLPDYLKVQKIISEEDNSLQSEPQLQQYEQKQQQQQQEQESQQQQQQQQQVKSSNPKKPQKKDTKKTVKEERWKNLAEISGKSIESVKNLCQKNPKLNDNEIIDKLLQ